MVAVWNVTEHVAEAPVPLNIQLADGVKVPPVVGFAAKLTLPPGVIAVPGELSVTVTMQLEDWPAVTLGGLQTTAVVVARKLTTMLAVPWLVLWLAVAG